MLQCRDCEFCQAQPDGELMFTCDPFTNIKEPHCLAKWQLLKINEMLSYQEQVFEMHQRFAPIAGKTVRAHGTRNPRAGGKRKLENQPRRRRGRILNGSESWIVDREPWIGLRLGN